jgi:hypothetical protein
MVVIIGPPCKVSVDHDWFWDTLRSGRVRDTLVGERRVVPHLDVVGGVNVVQDRCFDGHTVKGDVSTVTIGYISLWESGRSDCMLVNIVGLLRARASRAAN